MQTAALTAATPSEPLQPRRARSATSVPPPQRCLAQAKTRVGGHGAACSSAAALHKASRRSAGPRPTAVVVLTDSPSRARSLAWGKVPESRGLPRKAARSKSATSMRSRSTRSSRLSDRFSNLCLRGSRSTRTHRLPGLSPRTAAPRPPRPHPSSTITASSPARPPSATSWARAWFWTSCFSAWPTSPAPTSMTESSSSDVGSADAPSTSRTAFG
mmetsp:Transcript_102365/g.330140  ORF Transcript_102365/g.330140 Transcript_102365/m.330140 type:complete len:215 (+) Transcript_102365:265-909(+)